MLSQILTSIRNELSYGATIKGHPYRWFTLATQSESEVAQRTLVLRNILPNFEVHFYTDQRSEKIRQLKNNPKVSALFFHPQKLLQITLKGQVELVVAGAEWEKAWDKIPIAARKDYTTDRPPGTVIKNPDEVDYKLEHPHFVLVKIIPVQIDYLQLKRPNHLRARFVLEKEKWKGSFLVP